MNEMKTELVGLPGKNLSIREFQQWERDCPFKTLMLLIAVAEDVERLTSMVEDLQRQVSELKGKEALDE